MREGGRGGKGEGGKVGSEVREGKEREGGGRGREGRWEGHQHADNEFPPYKVASPPGLCGSSSCHFLVSLHHLPNILLQTATATPKRVHILHPLTLLL